MARDVAADPKMDGGAFPPIGRQKSPGMAFTHPQDLGDLGYR